MQLTDNVDRPVALEEFETCSLALPCSHRDYITSTLSHLIVIYVKSFKGSGMKLN